MGILQLPCDKTLRARVYVQTGKFTKVALLESPNCYDEFKAKRLTDGMVSQKAYSHLWEKNPLPAEAEFLFLIAHNCKAVIAMGFKPGITILQSLHYICFKFRAPPTSGLGVEIVSITRGQKSAVLCLPLVPYYFR